MMLDEQNINKWYHDTILGQPQNIDNVNLTKMGIRELARFYQLTQGLNASSAADKAAKQMISEVYLSPFDGLQLPQQIIHEGYITSLNEDYIKTSLQNIRLNLIKGKIPFDMEATFGKDASDIPAKIKATLAYGRWLLDSSRKQVYYAYPLENGSFQAIMTSPTEKLLFNLFDLNNPESEELRRERNIEETAELMERLPIMGIE